jgi:hypothetical protein
MFDPCNLRAPSCFDCLTWSTRFPTSESPFVSPRPKMITGSRLMNRTAIVRESGNEFCLQFHKSSAAPPILRRPAPFGHEFQITSQWTFERIPNEIAAPVLLAFCQGPEVLMHCILQCTSDWRNDRRGRRVWLQDAEFLACGGTSDGDGSVPRSWKHPQRPAVVERLVRDGPVVLGSWPKSDFFRG